MKPSRHYTLPFRSGDRVVAKVDPRHVGRVNAVFNSLTIQIRWNETGWLSEHAANELEHTSEE